MKLFNKYKFSDKSQALGGLISTAMGILSLLFLLVTECICLFKSSRRRRLKSRKSWNIKPYLSGNWNSNRTNQLQKKIISSTELRDLVQCCVGVIAVFMIAVFLMGI